MRPFLRPSLATVVALSLSLAVFVAGCSRVGVVETADVPVFDDESIWTDAAGLSRRDLDTDAPSTVAQHVDVEVPLDAEATPGDLFVFTDAAAPLAPSG